MRIIVLGDIHGNLGALTAALREADNLGYDRLLHTGDLIGYGPRPNETIDLIRERKIQGARGNFDENAAWGGDSPCADGDLRQQALADAAFRWTTERLGFGQRNFLKDVPFSIDEKIGERYLTVFHASPTDLYTPISERAPDSLLLGMAEDTGADVHVFGHTHRPFHRVVEGKHFINAGSVGCQGDGDPRACLAVLEIDGKVQVDFRRVAYDVEATAREAEEAGLPHEVAQRLRDGH